MRGIDKDITMLRGPEATTTIIHFQVPIEGMPIIDRKENELSSSLVQVAGSVSPRKMLLNVTKNAEASERYRKARQENDQDFSYCDILRIGKNSVPLQMIITALKESVSFRGGIRIPFAVDLSIARYALYENQRVPHHHQFLVHCIEHPFTMFMTVFFSIKGRLRGYEDFPQLFMLSVITPLTVLPELFSKVLGATCTQPFRYTWVGFFSTKDRGKQFGFVILGLFTLPLWALVQGLFVCGNTLGYARRSLDALFNMISILLAFCFGHQEKYPAFWGCVRVLTINGLQLFTAYVGLTSLLLLIPDLESAFSFTLFALPLTHTFLEAIPNAVEDVFSHIVEPLKKSTSSSAADTLGGITVFSIVGPFVQLVQAAIETTLIKIRNGSIWHACTQGVSWIKRQLQKRPRSMPPLEVDESNEDEKKDEKEEKIELAPTRELGNRGPLDTTTRNLSLPPLRLRGPSGSSTPLNDNNATLSVPYHNSLTVSFRAEKADSSMLHNDSLDFAESEHTLLNLTSLPLSPSGTTTRR